MYRCIKLIEYSSLDFQTVKKSLIQFLQTISCVGCYDFFSEGMYASTIDFVEQCNNRIMTVRFPLKIDESSQTINRSNSSTFSKLLLRFGMSGMFISNGTSQLPWARKDNSRISLLFIFFKKIVFKVHGILLKRFEKMGRSILLTRVIHRKKVFSISACHQKDENIISLLCMSWDGFFN